MNKLTYLKSIVDSLDNKPHIVAITEAKRKHWKNAKQNYLNSTWMVIALSATIWIKSPTQEELLYTLTIKYSMQNTLNKIKEFLVIKIQTAIKTSFISV